MKILYIAPLPPPITGHSLVSQVLLDALRRGDDPVVVDLSKDSFDDGAATSSRIGEVIGILRQVLRGRHGADAVYLTISESLLGNAKDLLIYLLCTGKMSRMVIHLHGGSIRRLLWDPHPVIRRVNAFFIRRLGGAIISGPSHLKIFDGLLPADRIHSVPNFAQDFMFASPDEVAASFAANGPLRILYMSNFIPGKGYADLLDAFLALPPAIAARVEIHFAGKFDSPEREKTFLSRIDGVPAIHYHGLVDESEKRRLFVESHVFCLPTTMLEGQPVSILEAYAAGCVVMTTGQPGIRDIFADGAQGYEIEPSAPGSIAAVISRIATDRSALREIGLANNRTAATRYRAATYTDAVRRVIAGVASTQP